MTEAFNQAWWIIQDDIAKSDDKGDNAPTNLPVGAGKVQGPIQIQGLSISLCKRLGRQVV